MTRHLVVAALFVLSLITYIDRAAISSAKEGMAADLGLSDQSMGAVFSAFALGYALAQVPSGWLADRLGPHLVLAIIMTAWSLLTGWTGLVRSVGVLLVVRFLFGVAEAGAFPGASRAIYNWLPVAERGRAHGIMFSGTRLGAAMAFPLMAWFLEGWGWRTSFLLLAIPGLAWAAGWSTWFRNRPAAVSAPADPAGPVPWRSGRFLLNLFQYFSGNFTFFICLSWMHPYLKSTYSLTQAEAAFYSMIPLLLGAGSQSASGFLVDRIYSSRFRAWSRRIPGMLGFLLAAVGVLALTQVGSAPGAAFCFALAAFGADLTISPSWVFCQDLGGKSSGALADGMNMVGNIGSFVSANAFPFLAQWAGTASAYFVVAALLNLLSVAAWYRMKSITD